MPRSGSAPAPLLAWAVLAYIVVDFGFLSKLVQTTPTDERLWRAGTEITLAAGLVIFLFTYLNLNRWHTNLSFATLAWIAGLGILSAFAVYDPVIATGLARFSFAATVFAGTFLIAYLGFNRFDRVRDVRLLGDLIPKFRPRTGVKQ